MLIKPFLKRAVVIWKLDYMPLLGNPQRQANVGFNFLSNSCRMKSIHLKVRHKIGKKTDTKNNSFRNTDRIYSTPKMKWDAYETTAVRLRFRRGI